MEYSGGKVDFRWLERVIRGEVNVEEEYASLVGTTLWSLNITFKKQVKNY